MADPTTPSAGATLVLAAAIAAFGPLVGQYMVICVGAFAGSLLALMLAPPARLLAGMVYMASGVILAIFTTGPLAWLWSQQLGLPAGEILAAVSFYVGLRRDFVLGLLRKKVERVDDQGGPQT